MTAEVTLPLHAGDPDPRPGSGAHVKQPTSSQLQNSSAAAHNPPTTVIPVGLYHPIAEPPADTGMLEASRKIKRLTETREIRVRTTHRRRKLFARGGVLAGFGLAMVVYPVMGNVVEVQRNTAEAVPGVVLGQSPTTGHALLGDGPALIPTVIDLPSPDDASQLIAMAAKSEAAYLASPLLPNCQTPATYEGEENGKIPADHLCLLPDGSNYLRADAAQAFAQLNAQFVAAFGRNMCIQEGYRSYADQVRIKGLRGYLAASPGTSMHGFGVAFDLCSGDDSGAPKAWLDATAGAYGFQNPDWAKFRKFEPWHWEYKPATDAMNIYGGSGTGSYDWGSDPVDPGATTTDPGTTATTPPADPVPTDPIPEPKPTTEAVATP